MAMSTERSPRCPGASALHHRLVGWHPCGCTGRTPAGHRTYWCQDCGLEISVPVCMRKDRTTLENGLRFR